MNCVHCGAALPDAAHVCRSCGATIEGRSIETSVVDPPTIEPAGTCTYCFWSLTDSDAVRCESCGTQYHADCWSEYGGCSVYGCANWLQQQMVGGATTAIAGGGQTASVSYPSAQPYSAAQPMTHSGVTRSAVSGAPQNSATPPAWHADPLARHTHRYWDGHRWTAVVADDGVVSNDIYGIKPTPLPNPPGGPSATASWYADTSGRHQHRYWSGRKWTDQVSDNGVVAVDPPVFQQAASTGPAATPAAATAGSSLPSPAPAARFAAPLLSPAPALSPAPGPSLFPAPLPPAPLPAVSPPTAES